MRLIDAEQLKDIIDDTWILDRIDEQPTVDAVEVVRCKDCKWWGKYGCAVSTVDESDMPKDDDFCAWGERREDGKNG